MTNERARPPQSVPILTEVVAWSTLEPWPDGEPVREPPLAPAEPPVSEPPADPDAPPERAPPPPERIPPAVPVGIDQVSQRVLLDLQQQVDLVLEYRVREVLTPILTRASDALVRDTRAALSEVLRDVVARSVAEELRRRRDS